MKIQATHSSASTASKPAPATTSKSNSSSSSSSKASSSSSNTGIKHIVEEEAPSGRVYIPNTEKSDKIIEKNQEKHIIDINKPDIIFKKKPDNATSSSSGSSNSNNSSLNESIKNKSDMYAQIYKDSTTTSSTQSKTNVTTSTGVSNSTNVSSSINSNAQAKATNDYSNTGSSNVSKNTIPENASTSNRKPNITNNSSTSTQTKKMDNTSSDISRRINAYTNNNTSTKVKNSEVNSNSYSKSSIYTYHNTGIKNEVAKKVYSDSDLDLLEAKRIVSGKSSGSYAKNTNSSLKNGNIINLENILKGVEKSTTNGKNKTALSVGNSIFNKAKTVVGNLIKNLINVNKGLDKNDLHNLITEKSLGNVKIEKFPCPSNGPYEPFPPKPKPHQPTKVSSKEVGFLKSYETFRKTAYDPGDRTRTIGYGHVIIKGEHFQHVISKQEGTKILQKDLKSHGNTIKKWAKDNKVKLSQNQFDALADFDFNTGGFLKSTLAKDIANRNVSSKTMKKDFLMWVKVNKGAKNEHKSGGLYRRRMDEWQMFTKGDYKRNYPKIPKGYK